MKIEFLTAYTLRIGVFLSLLLISLGIVSAFLSNSTLGYSVDLLADPHSLVNTETINYNLIYNGLTKFEGLSFMLLGLMILIATPIIRVILSIIVFAQEGDRLYLAITCMVLTIILITIFLVPFYA